jgi:SAM-dependent methyltransferase
MKTATVDGHWYKTFFEGVALDCWRKCVPADQTRSEVDFLETELCCAPGGRVLDVPCGHGRHTLELAGRGYRMTGVDISEGEICEAGLRAAPAARSIEWLCADMRDLNWEAEFDAAFCFGNSFGYLEFADMQTFLAGVASALRPGARFIVETGMAAESILPKMQERDWYQVDDILFAITNNYRPETSRLETECTFVRGGKTERKRFSHGVYTVAEIRRMLAAGGFQTKVLYGSLSREPFRLGDRILYLVAEKES